MLDFSMLLRRVKINAPLQFNMAGIDYYFDHAKVVINYRQDHTVYILFGKCLDRFLS